MQREHSIVLSENRRPAAGAIANVKSEEMPYRKRGAPGNTLFVSPDLHHGPVLKFKF
jgi:hypothetical protein